MKKVFLIVSLLSAVGFSAQWGGTEIASATDVALSMFQDKFGKDVYAQVVSVTSELRPPKYDAASIKVGYRAAGQSAPTVKSYFCHEHEPGEIDCH